MIRPAETDERRYHLRVKLRPTAAGLDAFLGALATLFALGNSRVGIAGLLLCPVLLLILPLFDSFPDLDDTWFVGRDGCW
jgi:hypothetical protein